MTSHQAETDAEIYDGVGRAIRSVAPVESLHNGARGDARIAAGIAVYRNNVRAALLRVLRDTFPVTHRLVGEEFFRYLAHEYFHAHPPASPLVARYGDNIPEYLESFQPASGLPYLPDVARLELAWLGAYHAAEADCLEPRRIFAALAEEPESAIMELHPSARLVRSPFPVHAIWLHNRNEKTEKLRPPAEGECVVIKRPAHHVFTETVAEPVWAALKALEQKRTFAAAISTAIETDDGASAADIVQAIATMNVISAVRNAA